MRLRRGAAVLAATTIATLARVASEPADAARTTERPGKS